jgi:hypothetical protein
MNTKLYLRVLGTQSLERRSIRRAVSRKLLKEKVLRMRSGYRRLSTALVSGVQV